MVPVYRNKKNWRGVATLLSAAFLIAACGTTKVQDAAADMGTTTSWSVRLAVSGGFAGVRQQIEVDQDGRLSLDDEKLKKHVDGQLKPPELKKLASLVRSSFAAPPAGKSGRSKCFDCFDYTLTLKADGQTIQRRYDNLSIVGSSDYRLVHMLSSTMARQLSPDKKKPSC
jgi:hypothetical protein